ncbi:MAG: endonuclease/exonuclease/phosphatase family protein [Planctomycetes bacterium]|nr:endonuclease/exonuclease/phosphatase family protein [Planctomycetota bacterium]
MVRVVSWNIQHGGGSRKDAIVEALRSWSPDVVALSEFRGTSSSRQIHDFLRDQGLGFVHSTTDSDSPRKNRLLVASRWKLHVAPARGLLGETGRWIDTTVQTRSPFKLIAMHVPNRASGEKYDFLAATVEALDALSHEAALAIGDANTGVPSVDEQVCFFNQREGDWFDKLRAVGWIDAYRRRNPKRREFTWYSRSNNGFRLDQVFATETMNPRIRRISYDWGCADGNDQNEPSDHAAILVDLDV